jgi:hypothetical protein
VSEQRLFAPFVFDSLMWLCSFAGNNELNHPAMMNPEADERFRLNRLASNISGFELRGDVMIVPRLTGQHLYNMLRAGTTNNQFFFLASFTLSAAYLHCLCALCRVRGQLRCRAVSLLFFRAVVSHWLSAARVGCCVSVEAQNAS